MNHASNHATSTAFGRDPGERKRGAARRARRRRFAATTIAALVVSLPLHASATPALPSASILAGLTADTIGMLDPATNRVTENYAGTTSPTVGFATLNRSGVGLVAQPGNAGASLSLAYGPAPAAAASAYSAVTGTANPAEKPNPALAYDGYGSYEGDANAKIFYSLEFTGPGPTVLVDIAAVLKVGGSGYAPGMAGTGSAGIEIDDAGYYATFQDALALTADNQITLLHVGNGTSSETAVSSSTYVESGAYTFDTGYVYSVIVGATAEALVLGSLTSSDGAANGFASIDPTFAIDPGMRDAGAYGILLSAGIGNSAAPAAAVPEPPLVALFFGGLAVASFGARRARRPRPRAADRAIPGECGGPS